MTRLTDQHIRETAAQIDTIDAALESRVGVGLREVARRVIGVETEDATLPSTGRSAAVVPITAGEGVIGGFCDTVRAIAAHIGFSARVTAAPDVGGIAEAFMTGDDIIVMADDHRFVAVNTRFRTVVDNNRATGEGFAALLDMIAGGVFKKPCGVIGCGPVGSAAALRLAKMGVELTVCDMDKNKARQAAQKIGREAGVPVAWLQYANDLLAECPYIVDATPAAGIIDAASIQEGGVMVAPGVPHGLTPAAAARLGTSFYHDNLPLGTAVMMLASAYNRMTETAQRWF